MRAGATLVVLALLLCMPLVHALPPAKEYDAEPHVGADFPMGTVELTTSLGQDVGLHYPAIEAGVKTQMAGNGPFPVVLFLPTDGEGTGDYTLFAETLVARGYVVAVADEVPEGPWALQPVLDRVYEVSEGDGTVPGSLDSMSEQWAIGGHGDGAAAALEMAGRWFELGRNAVPPSGIFGLGLSDDGTLIDDGEVTDDALDLLFDAPAVSLLITGSVDDVAPVETNVLPLLDSGIGVGLHVMTLRGANHNQWKDSTGLFAGGDGTATITQEEQHNIAALHVVALLDLTTRGDHDAFAVAFNRPSDPGILSDADAYLDEDLTAAELLRLNVTSPTNQSGTEVSGVLEFRGQIGLWDGSDWHADGRAAEAMCWINDESMEVYGSVNATGWFSCDLNVTDVEPGLFDATLKLSIDGAPVQRSLTLVRGNGPLESLAPVPAVIVPQGGLATLRADTLATDPDGHDVLFTSAQLEGNNASKFELTVMPGGASVEIRDASDEDWLGGAVLNASLSAAGETSPLQVSVQVRMGEVNNPVRVLGVPPTLVFDEDGPQQSLDLNAHVVDPEGAPLQVMVQGGMWADIGPVRAAVMGSNLSVLPLANASGSVVIPLTVSDGTTEAASVNVTVVVKPVNDPPVLNQTGLDLTLLEDGVLDVDLLPLAWDADGDLPVISVVDPPTALTVLDVVDATLEIRPLPHANGRVQTSLLFAFPDAELTLPLTIVIEPVEDAGSIRLDWVRPLSGNQIEVRWTVEDRDDLTNTTFEGIMSDGDGLAMLEAGTPSCGPALLDDRGVPLWSVTCDSVWNLPSSSLMGMTLRVEELHTGSDEGVVYLLPIEVEASPDATVDDEARGSTGTLLFAGGAVVLAVLGLVAWRAKD
ncbi:MAG: hypothetical protein CMB41_05130 [Euryarchaeota archaeon]|nr:hypothetical protein [Euryarchaeota archaeon]